MKRWHDKNWQEKMEIRFDFNNIMADSIGKEDGISEQEIKKLMGRCQEIAHDLIQKRKNGKLPFYDLPYQSDVVRGVKNLATLVKARGENFVVLGIGGSALGAIALHTALNNPGYNHLSRAVRKGYPRIFFSDNIDPDGFQGLLDTLNLKETVFNVISKSGSTVETMSQFLIVREKLLGELGSKYKERIVITTDAKGGILRKIADDEGFESLVIPAGVGGRFSVFTPVGLFPAAITGIDIEELLAGASCMDERCRSTNLWENPAHMDGVLHYLANVQKKKRISVMMPYSDALKDVADWYRQLWAESLGKKLSLDGRVINAGQTPIKALGVTDQHSQLQLYIEGPNDKIITLLAVENPQNAGNIPITYEAIEEVSYLGGHCLKELIRAERLATELALTKNRRPNCTITLPEVNPFTVGQLLYLFEVETAFAGELYQINPFDQPGVEEGKKFAYGMMGRKGYEDKREEVEKITRKKKYII